MGTIEQGDTVGAIAFHYDPSWRGRADAFPLSLSMPLAESTHAGDVPSQFFRALLPDNPTMREAFAERHQVAASDTFGLLAALGEDCPGAIQCVRAERVSSVTNGVLDRVQWLSPAALLRRLDGLRKTGVEVERAGEAGQFSLAGAQAKSALLYDGRADRWGVPSGRVPTTHILKPAPAADPRRADNEHLCLELAAQLGLPVARSAVLRSPEGDTLVVNRFDRVRLENGEIARLHQEDFCQALGIAPELKYEHRGGPSPRQIVTLLRERSARARDDITTFVSALVLNWVLYGTDAHGRNYSVLIGSFGRVQLAPLYDIISALPYRHVKEHTINLSMIVGSTRHGPSIDAAEWRALALHCAMPWEPVHALITDVVQRIGASLPIVVAKAISDGMPEDFSLDFERRAEKRVRRCERQMRD